MILEKKLKFLSSLLFFEQGRDMYFYDVVYRKRVFRLQKCHFHILESFAFLQNR